MEPTINTYDLIIVKINQNVGENDIVTFYSDNTFITHRIIKYKSDDKILTKGDANNTSDKYISKDAIIGKVIYNIRGFGIIKRTITEPKVLIGIFSTILLFSLAFSINTKGDKNEK